MNYSEILNIRSHDFFVPEFIVRDNDLTNGAKLLYGDIAILIKKKGRCLETNNFFANLHNCDKRTIIRWVKELRDKEYISTEIGLVRFLDGTVQTVREIFINENGG